MKWEQQIDNVTVGDINSWSHGLQIPSDKLNYEILILSAGFLVPLILAKAPFRTPACTHEAHPKKQIWIFFSDNALIN